MVNNLETGKQMVCKFIEDNCKTYKKLLEEIPSRAEYRLAFLKI